MKKSENRMKKKRWNYTIQRIGPMFVRVVAAEPSPEIILDIPKSYIHNHKINLSLSIWNHNFTHSNWGYWE
jgi:hypothetical protein